MIARSRPWSVRIRRQVTFGGRVLDPQGSPVTGGAVALTSLEPQTRGRCDASPGAVPSAGGQRCTAIRPDGRYFFLDLPPGQYTVDGQDRNGRPIHARVLSVVALGPGGRLGFDLHLSATEGAARAAGPQDRGRSKSALRRTVVLGGLRTP